MRSWEFTLGANTQATCTRRPGGRHSQLSKAGPPLPALLLARQRIENLVDCALRPTARRARGRMQMAKNSLILIVEDDEDLRDIEARGQ